MPNWLSWAAHSRLPLPSLRTYAVMSLGVFLGAVLNCTSLSSSGKSGSSYSHDYIFFPHLLTTQSDKDEKEATDTDPSETPSFPQMKWSSISNYFKFTDETNSKSAMKVEKALMATLWNLIFPVSDSKGSDVLTTTSESDGGSGEGSKPFDTLSQWSEKYTGGFPKSWSQMPYYIAFLFQHSLFVWSLINLSYCVLLMVSRSIQKFVFGELRVVERQNLRDSFWNYMFYKFIFLFGVLNVQQLGELVLWSFWFSSFSFLRLMNQLSRDRFEYIAYSPNRSSNLQQKIFALLMTIFICNLSLFAFAISVHSVTSDLNVFGFMLSECIQLLLRNVLVVLKLAFHIRDVSYLETWENKALYVYYADFIVEMTALSFDLVHHAHMLIWSNVFLSMACLVICMQVRALVLEMQRRLARHKEFCLVTKHMDAMFPEVRYSTKSKTKMNSAKSSAEESREAESSDQKSDCDVVGSKPSLESGENNVKRDFKRKDSGGESPCAICWDVIVVGRKLPCSHIFHRSCLRSWLVQDSTCPTCRHALKFSPNSTNNSSTGAGASNAPGAQPPVGVQLSTQNPIGGLLPGISSLPVPGFSEPRPGVLGANGQGSIRRNYFHFDGSRIASWLPSFSVELTHGSSVESSSNSNNSGPTEEVSSAQREHWVHQVHILLPQIPLNVIRESLAITNSLEVTIDHILEGLLDTSITVGEDEEESLASDDLGSWAIDKRSFSIVDSRRGHYRGSNGDTISNTNVQIIEPSHLAEASVTVEPVRERSRGSVSGAEAEFTAVASPFEFDLNNIPPSKQSNTQDTPGTSTSYSETGMKLSLKSRKRESNLSPVVSSQNAILLQRESSPIRPLEVSNDNNVSSNSSVVFGERFSKSPQEREQILKQRKENMILCCRRAYLLKHPNVERD